ncbi:uncharacterized protein LOC126844398 isoform X2 [Adelges cooleyi]|uniref:uncharacterized protein LOC126844398 isoform X2 n=1 Tax=Adelges cooleyi TaxID=133065 RepID=UPI00217F3F09|nr:uncharacterized protein LOC126844398 isoform X2 [Adelges cooleyi]
MNPTVTDNTERSSKPLKVENNHWSTEQVHQQMSDLNNCPETFGGTAAAANKPVETTDKSSLQTDSRENRVIVSDLQVKRSLDDGQKHKSCSPAKIPAQGIATELTNSEVANKLNEHKSTLAVPGMDNKIVHNFVGVMENHVTDEITKKIKLEYVEDTFTNNAIITSNGAHEKYYFEDIKPTTIDIPNDDVMDLKDTTYNMYSCMNTKYVDEFVDIKSFMKLENMSNDANKTNQSKTIHCPHCEIDVGFNYYQAHVQTVDHKVAFFKDKIDFDDYYVFPSVLCSTMLEFLNSRQKEFTVLVNHVVEEHIAVEVDVSLFALYREKSNDSKNIAEGKQFSVKNKVMSGETNIAWLYEDIVNSFLYQTENFQRSRWSLEGIICLKIDVVKSLIDIVHLSTNKTTVIHNMPANSISNESTENTMPEIPKMRLMRCQLCNNFFNRDYYSEHLETSHRKSDVKGRRRLLPKHRAQHTTASEFFRAIKPDVLDIVSEVMLTSPTVVITVELFVHYNDDSNAAAHNTRWYNYASYTESRIKCFAVTNKVLTRTSSLSNWYEMASNDLKRQNQEMLTNEPMWSLDCIMFLEISFSEYNV